MTLEGSSIQKKNISGFFAWACRVKSGSQDTRCLLLCFFNILIPVTWNLVTKN